MNIFIRELKSNVKSLLIWGVIVGILVTIGIAKFSAYEGNPNMVEILDAMPAPMLEAFSMNAFNLTTIEGFFGVMFTFFGLLVSIAAAMWGSEIISKEERDKTVEFSLTLPVPRSRLVTAKLLAAVVNCIGLLLITYGASYYSVGPYEPEPLFYEFMNLSMVALFIMQMVFLAVGILLGCAMKDHKRAGSTAVSVLLVTYFLSIVSGLSEDYEFLKYFSPFKYFDPVDLLHKSEIDLGFVGLSAGIVVVALVVGYVSYARRDLYI